MNTMDLLLEATKMLKLWVFQLEGQQANFRDPHYTPHSAPFDIPVWRMSPEQLATYVTPNPLEDNVGYNLTKVETALERLRAVNDVIDIQNEFASRDVAKGLKVQAVIKADTGKAGAIGEGFNERMSQMHESGAFTQDLLHAYSHRFMDLNLDLVRILDNQSPQSKALVSDQELVEALFDARARYARLALEDMDADCQHVRRLHEKVSMIWKGMDETILSDNPDSIRHREAYLLQAEQILDRLQESAEAMVKFTTQLVKMGTGLGKDEFQINAYVPLPLSP